MAMDLQVSVRSVPAWEEPHSRTVMGHTAEVDRFLIRTAAGQAGIGDHGGQIARNAPALGPGQVR